MILSKIIRIVFARCRMLRLNFTQFDFCWGPQTPRREGSLQRFPSTQLDFKGSTSEGWGQE